MTLQLSNLTTAILCLTALLSTINATFPDVAPESRDKAPEQRGDFGVLTSSLDGRPAPSDVGSSSTRHQLDDESHQTNDAASSAESADGDVAKRAMGMLRLGRAGSRQPSDRRAMSALRLGRRSGWNPGSVDESAATGSDGASAAEAEKDKRKSMSMLRLGRGGSQVDQPTSEFKDEEKKAMSALRLGRKRGSGDDGLNELQQQDDVSDEDAKRAMGMLRLGRNMEDDDSDLQENDNEKRAMGMLRLGRQSIAAPSRIDRRKSMAMLRLG